MNQTSKYLIATATSSILVFGCLITTSSKALADVKIGNNQQTNQTKSETKVYSIDEWPEVREQLCGKCKPDSQSEENKVSVPEPSSVIALLMIGCSSLLAKISPQKLKSLRK